MECSFYVKLQVSQDTQVSFINCYSTNISFCCDLQWQALKGYTLLDCNSLETKYLHALEKPKKNRFFTFALMERTEAQTQQSPYADSFYHVHIFMCKKSKLNGICIWTKLK